MMAHRAWFLGGCAIGALIGTLACLALFALTGWVGVLGIGALAGGLVMAVLTAIWFVVGIERRWV